MKNFYLDGKADSSCGKDWRIICIKSFKNFDKDNCGKITNYEFKYILTQMGKKFSEDEVNQLFKECNLDINGILVYQDFINFWKKH